MDNGKTMNRRGFLATLAVAAGALLVRGKGVAARPTELPSVSLCRCPIAGFQYHQGRALLPKLKAGQTLVLKREPANPHDSLAIAVHTTKDGKLGYLPRRLNEIPSGLMDGGQGLTAVIVAVDRDAPIWQMVEVEVRLGLDVFTAC